MSAFANCIVLHDTVRSLKPLFTKIRSRDTGRVDFCRYARRLMGIICEEGLTYLPTESVEVVTPTGNAYEGSHIDVGNVVAVSIIRAGDSMLDTFTGIAPEAAIGKILIQRDEETALPKLYYCKLPSLANKQVVLLDPMLATGGSAICAIHVLLEHGAKEENLTFFNVLACPEGIRNVLTTFPKMKIVTGEVDPKLNEKGLAVPFRVVLSRFRFLHLASIQDPVVQHSLISTEERVEMFNNEHVMSWMETTFKLESRQTNVMQEWRAATATFLTMSYILLVNPQLLSKIGVSPTDVVVSTALSSFVGSFLAGMFGNMPLGLAPGIGLSAYLTYGLVMGEGLSVAEAFTACFVSGLLLLVFSLTGISQIIMKLIPRSVKIATIVGMGLQIALVGMTSVKLVVPNEQTIVGLGDISNYQIWCSLFGLLLIGTLLFHQVRGAILIGIVVMTAVTWYLEDSFPNQLLQFPSINLNPARFIDFEGFSVWRTMPGILSFMFIGIIDVSGVVFGMASLANLTLPDGSIPGSMATFAATSVGSLVSACTGGTPIIVYVESAAGIKEGGRTGLTALFISAYFLLAIILAPLLASIPLTATSPVAILVGAMMMSQSVELDWNNMSEAIPAFLTAIIMPFTFSITNGIVFGLIAAFVFYLTTGQFLEDGKALLCGRSGDADNEMLPLNSRSSSFHSVYSDVVPLDTEVFVRVPSLLLTKKEADSLLRARGMSIDESSNRNTPGSHNASYSHIELRATPSSAAKNLHGPATGYV